MHAFDKVSGEEIIFNRDIDTGGRFYICLIKKNGKITEIHIHDTWRTQGAKHPTPKVYPVDRYGGYNHHIRHGEKPLVKGETKLKPVDRGNNVVGPEGVAHPQLFSDVPEGGTEDRKNLVGDSQLDKNKVIIECPSGYFQNGRSSTWIHERNLG